MEEKKDLVPAAENAEEAKEEKSEPKTYTRDDLNKIIATEKAKAREEALKEAEEKKTEAERLAKMKAEERLKYEAEQERTKREAIEAKLNAYELKEQALKIANSEEGKMPVGLINLIDFTRVTAENVKERLTEIKKTFDAELEKAVSERLKEKPPYEQKDTPTSKSSGIRVF